MNSLLPPAETSRDTGAGYSILSRRHHRPLFQLAHALLRDANASEEIACLVLDRLRRRLARGEDPAAALCRACHCSLRLARRRQWRFLGRAARRRLDQGAAPSDEFDLAAFVRVIATRPGLLADHDCEIVALRHVLGLPLVQIGRLLRMHPYEVSNRLAWCRERLSGPAVN